MFVFTQIRTALQNHVRSHLPGICAVVLLLLGGLYCIPRLGISWDEPVQRQIGLANYNYIANGDTSLLGMRDRIYGVAFELPLIYAEKHLLPHDSRSIYLFRHYSTFTFFCLAVYVFYCLCLRAFGSRSTALAGMVLFVLCPRILGHSYFNTKDIPFLCMQVLAMYALFRALFNGKFRPCWWLGFALFCGLLINIRIIGIATWASGAGALLLISALQRNLKLWPHLFSFLLLSLAVLYAGWPFLWKDPLHNFQLAWNTMAHFPWDGYTRFGGEDLPAGQQPARYILGWMAISIPLPGIILCLSGVLFLIYRSIRLQEQTLLLFGWIQFMCSWGILGMVILQKSVLYDDWRHLYFIWPGLVWNAVWLIHALAKRLRTPLRITFAASGLAYVLWIIAVLFRLSPYHYIYFNELIPRSQNYRIQQFDLDYWGLSYYEGLQYILEHDARPQLNIRSYTHEQVPSFELLTPAGKQRIHCPANLSDADYLMTITRFHKLNAHNLKEFPVLYHAVYREGSPVLQIWKKQ